MVKIEDLRIGQEVWVGDIKHKILGLDSSKCGFQVLLQELGGHGWCNIDIISVIPPKQKKRYWLWDVKSHCEYHGSIAKFPVYMDENGVGTLNNHHIHSGGVGKEYLIRKHEDEFIDIDE